MREILKLNRKETKDLMERLIDEIKKEAQEEAINGFIEEVKKKGFYDDIIEKDLIKFLKEYSHNKG